MPPGCKWNLRVTNIHLLVSGLCLMETSENDQNHGNEACLAFPFVSASSWQRGPPPPQPLPALGLEAGQVCGGQLDREQQSQDNGPVLEVPGRVSVFKHKGCVWRVRARAFVGGLVRGTLRGLLPRVTGILLGLPCRCQLTNWDLEVFWEVGRHPDPQSLKV